MTTVTQGDVDFGNDTLSIGTSLNGFLGIYGGSHEFDSISLGVGPTAWMIDARLVISGDDTAVTVSNADADSDIMLGLGEFPDLFPKTLKLDVLDGAVLTFEPSMGHTATLSIGDIYDKHASFQIIGGGSSVSAMGATVEIKSNGTLKLEDGGSMVATSLWAAATEGTSTVLISGTGSTLSLAGYNGGPAAAVLGDDAGTSSLTVEDGAEMHISSDADAATMTLGQGAGSTGTVLIAGSGSRLSLSGETGSRVTIGSDGTGSMRLESGAVLALNAGATADGQVEIQGDSELAVVGAGTTVTADFVQVGNGSGTSVVTVTSGGTLMANVDVGSTGVLAAENGVFVGNTDIGGTLDLALGSLTETIFAGNVSADDATIKIELSNSGNGDLISVMGDAVLGDVEIQADVTGSVDGRVEILTTTGDLYITGDVTVVLSDGTSAQALRDGTGSLFIDTTYDSHSGSTQSDMMHGTDAAEVLRGQTGNDRMFGDAGDDFLFGGGGSDLINGGAGADVLDGGTGFDFVDYKDVESALVIDQQTPGNSSADYAEDTLISVEGIFGAQDHSNTFVGDDSRMFFTGGNIADTLYGGGGKDILRGGSGDDVIDGGADRDALLGNDGNDVLTGGADRDIFWFGLGPDGHDLITDFTIETDLLGFQGTAVDTVDDLTFSAGASGWAVLEWNGGADSVELQGVTEVEIQADANFYFS